MRDKSSIRAATVVIGCLFLTTLVRGGLRVASWASQSKSLQSSTFTMPVDTRVATNRPTPIGFSRHLRLSNGWILFCGDHRGVIILEDGACENLALLDGKLIGNLAGDTTSLELPPSDVVQFLASNDADNQTIQGDVAILTLVDLCSVPETQNMHTSLVVDLVYGATESARDDTDPIEVEDLLDVAS